MSHCRKATLCGILPLVTLWSAWAQGQVAPQPAEHKEADSPPSVNSTPAPTGAASGTSELRLRQARDLFTKGSLAFKAGNHTEAIEAFLIADELVPSAALSFNVARVYEAKGDWGQSIYWYLDYLRRSPEAADEAAVRARIAELGSALTQGGRQLVVVRCDSPASVFIGARQLGDCPLGVVVEPGPVSFRLVKEGQADAIRDVDVSLSDVAVLEVTWPPTSQPPSAAEGTAAARGVDATPEVQRSTLAKPDLQAVPKEASAAELQHDNLAAARWIALGGGTLALALGGVFEWVRHDAEEDARRTAIQVDRKAELERMSDWKTAARVSAGVGGALLLAGGALWLAGGTESRSASSPRTAVEVGVAPVVDWSGAGVRVIGSY